MPNDWKGFEETFGTMLRPHSSLGQGENGGLRPMTRAIVYGGLTVGTLDLFDAFVFFGLRSGTQPIAILHNIAARFVGRDAARAGGMPIAALGPRRLLRLESG